MPNDKITAVGANTGRIYDTDLEEILGFQKETTARLNDILTKLSALK